MKPFFLLISGLVFGSLALYGDTLLVGGPGDPFNGDCAPFGCASDYQQVYDSALFSGPVSITGITFFNLNFLPGEVAPATYTMSLSTTSAAVNGLSATLADNLGADNQAFFTGALGGPIDATGELTLAGTAFVYDPTLGNLLLNVTKDAGEFEFSVFMDFLSVAPANTFSRAYNYDGSGIAEFVESDIGLVTQFTFTPISEPEPEPTPVPEPGSLSSLLGVLALLGVKCFRTRTR